MAGPAVTVSIPVNLPSLAPKVVKRWGFRKDTHRPGRGASGSRRGRHQRGFHRRDFRSRQKGGFGVGPTKRGKGTKIMAIADASGLPCALHVASASPHEVKLVGATLERRFLSQLPDRIIGDRAYDSDPLDRELAARGIERDQKPRTIDHLGAIANDGRSNGSLPGFRTIAVSLPDGSITFKTSSEWFNSAVCSSSPNMVFGIVSGRRFSPSRGQLKILNHRLCRWYEEGTLLCIFQARGVRGKRE